MLISAPIVSMQALINRIKMDTEMKEKHPEHADMFERRIEKHKSDLIALAMQNDGNLYAERLLLSYAKLEEANK